MRAPRLIAATLALISALAFQFAARVGGQAGTQKPAPPNFIII